MAFFKCKMCGGTLEIQSGQAVAECEYCGAIQTLPKLDDEKRANLYDRANHFRRSNEFDKATAFYEQILNEDGTDAEAYWSLVLCRYGIEYVEDPLTHKRVPTVHRAQFTSIFDDENYKLAFKNADTYQRILYEGEARAINEIQKGILAISQKEDPFDVFICYKETDDSGKRTHDSVVAQDLYYLLKQEGFKVFFARITLEDKLGTAYEPYIFAALNSAKVMVALGTKPEYFNAVWVKNEWSRFLSLIKQGEKKMLIPAYKDMDPYHLPKEFSHLQAQDMSKLGFMQDLIRGIKKILGNDKKQTQPVTERVIVNNEGHDTAPLLRRAYLFLEDGNFDSADEYAEKVLDINPECAEAYVVKLLIELGLKKTSDFAMYKKPFSESPNYQKAIRFASPEYREIVEGYNNSVIQRIDTERKNFTYSRGVEYLNAGRFDDAIGVFKTIEGFKDAKEKIKLCAERKENARRDEIYSQAVMRVSSHYATDTDLKKSIRELHTINGYRDVDDKIRELNARLEKWYEDKKKAEEAARIKAEEERRTREREAELRRIKAEQTKKKLKKAAKIGVPSLAALATFLVLLFTLIIPLIRYNQADALFNEGKYGEALALYKDIEGFSKSEQRIEVLIGIKQIDMADYDAGIKKILASGVPVKLTYGMGGGDFKGATYVSAPEDLTETLLSLMSASAPAETAVPETVEMTFNSSADFTGFQTPGRNGYRFVKWELDAYNYEVGGTFEIKLNAVWHEKDYVIDYKLNDGNIHGKNVREYDPEDDSFTLINPTRTGYTFAGWTGTDLSEPTLVVTIPKGSYGDRTYIATWTPNEYTVTYDTAGGTISSETQKVAYDSNVEYLIPERAGYKFLGWYETVSNGRYETLVKHENEKWTRTSDLTLIAEWEIVTYKINYVLNGGTNNTTNPIYYTIYSNTISLKFPSRTGYTFTGWTYEGQTTPTTSVTIPKGSYGNKTFTANWEAISSTITLNPNGGSCNPTTISVTYDQEFSLPNCVWAGHTFSGWYSGNTEITNGICNFTEDITLVAEWDVIQYTITYTLNGGTNASTNPTSYNYHDTFTLAPPTRVGYTFLGWTFIGQTTPTMNVTVNVGTTLSKTYTANWAANTYTVTLDANGGTVSSAKLNATFDTNVTLPTPTRTGYTFSGWFDGTKQYTTGTWKIDSNVTLVAKWTVNSYKATYDANGGTVSSSYQTYTFDEEYALLEPTRRGYEFLGWYTEETVVPQTGTWKFDEDRSLVAKWKACVYTVTYDAGDGTCSESTVQATYGSEFTPATATRVGYWFRGWTYSYFNYSVPFSWLIDEDITLTANWVARTDIPYVVNHYQQNANDDGYTLESSQSLKGTADATITPEVMSYAHFVSPTAKTVTIAPDGSLVVDYYYDRVTCDLTYVTNGGDTIEKQTYKYDQTFVIETPKRNGYTFGGWFTDATLETAYFATATLKANITLYAYWTEENKPTDFKYESNFGSVNISGYKGTSTTMWIPSYIGGLPVRKISNSAFYNQTTLVKVIVPTTVTSMGVYCFAGCNSIEELTAPFVGNSASDSDGLSILFHYAVPSTLKKVTITVQTTIPEDAFVNCRYIEEINIPETVISIGNSAFYGCTSLLRLNSTVDGELNLPDKVRTIDNFAFCELVKITKVYVPDSITSLGFALFQECTSIEEITIPFVGALKGENDEEKNRTFDSLFANSATWRTSNNHVLPSIKKVTITKQTSIPEYAFCNCQYIEEITILENTTSIGVGAFSDCTSLTSIEIPDSVTSIGDSVFNLCSSLTSINFEGTIEQWIGMEKGSNWDMGTGAYTIYCTDGVIPK